MNRNFVCWCALLLFVAAAPVFAAQSYTVELNKDPANGWELLVDGEQVPINGVVWSFTPIGEDYNYNLWEKDDRFIRQMIDTDGPLLQAMGVNSVRLFSDIPPRWITYLYRRYGIYTIVNDLMSRYGRSVDGKWYPNTDYAMPRTRELILEDAIETIEEYKDVEGVLFFLFGNENNYGLQWKSNAIEDLPVGERSQTRARYLYSMFGEVIDAAKARTSLPIGIVNGDTQYLQIIAEEASNLDIFGMNVYRGDRAQAIMFESVAEVLDRPIVYTEFGADAFNASTQLEDPYNQALFLREQWQEIYEQSYGKGRAQNMLGGLIFEWLDEWWKYGLDIDIDIHNTEGTWRQPTYYDHVGGANNMNEEWWGIVAQSPETERGIHKRVPRAAYYVMQDVWQRSLYEVSNRQIAAHFAGVSIADAVAQADSRSVRELVDEEPVRVSGSLEVGARGHFSSAIDQMEYDAVDFSHQEVATIEVQAEPVEGLTTEVTLRAQLSALDDALSDSYAYLISPQGENYEIDGVRRVPLEIYSAAFLYETRDIEINGYFHDGIKYPGHADNYLEGDFFNIYPETFDRVGMDLTGSKAPYGVEIVTKRSLQGLELFIGPEIYWGSEPAAYFKFYRQLFDNFYLGAVHYEAFQARQYPADEIDGAAPPPNEWVDRRSSLLLDYTLPALGPATIRLQGGALMSGTHKIDEFYTGGDGSTNTITLTDTLGFKGRLTALVDTAPVFEVFGEYIHAGVVADSQPFLERGGSFIADTGGSNRQEIVAGGNVWIGDLVLSPKFRWRTPLQEPHPNRNSLTQPFYVWGENRELLQGELLVTYDLTGATYFHQWNNDDRENALFAGSLGFLYTFMQGETDTGHFRAAKTDSGTVPYYRWNGGMEAVDNLWSTKARIVSNFAPNNKAILNASYGMEQNLGQPAVQRAENTVQTIFSAGLDLQLNKWELGFEYLENVWGPDNWHYEFGFTIPQQIDVLLAYHFGDFSFVEPANRLGVQFRGRWFDEAPADSLTAINPLGVNTDEYRYEVTMFYQLRF